ncbi:hypothetical protein PGT21_015966 [Puccinia graminis f. sp. tritici]|uniref:Uncharacterized protein n=1 Tax=Puccinia graminis f. sp. tritici TaxID=56615 RepID=A0A5B0PCQ1_PUCGR|nr:hypothetical protein PGTUg99_010728 [Puccinia graminis f. sp. tritici]KAA1105696.1 hypothetical protein PGT21_015966 [Puccinia graminis f. sp. tritici]
MPSTIEQKSQRMRRVIQPSQAKAEKGVSPMSSINSIGRVLATIISDILLVSLARFAPGAVHL